MNARRMRRRGMALAMSLVSLTILVIVFGTLTRMAVAERKQVRAEERRLRAGWLAESGLERAWARLAASPAYSGETWTLSAETLKGRDSAVIRIAVERKVGDSGHLLVSAVADYPSEGASRARQTRTARFPVKNQANPGADR